MLASWQTYTKMKLTLAKISKVFSILLPHRKRQATESPPFFAYRPAFSPHVTASAFFVCASQYNGER